jgi:hypothetical protein
MRTAVYGPPPHMRLVASDLGTPVMRDFSEHEIDQIGATLDGVITAIGMTVGRCRFEGTTLRSSGLVVPEIWAAAERLVGGPLLDPHMLRGPDGVLWGRLNARTIHMLGTTAMLKAWPALLDEWTLTGWPGECWLTFHRADEPRPVEKPPRIDHIVRICLGHDWFPLYGPWLLPDCAHVTDLHGGCLHGRRQEQTMH